MVELTTGDIIGMILIGLWIEGLVTAGLGILSKSRGLEFLNPLYLYSKWKVNWFGASFLALIFNLLTLPVAIFYWIYKLCTVGR